MTCREEECGDSGGGQGDPVMVSLATCRKMVVGDSGVRRWADGELATIGGAKDTKEGLGNLFRAAREESCERGRGKAQECEAGQRDATTTVDPPKDPKEWQLALRVPDGRVASCLVVSSMGWPLHPDR